VDMIRGRTLYDRSRKVKSVQKRASAMKTFALAIVVAFQLVGIAVSRDDDDDGVPSDLRGGQSAQRQKQIQKQKQREQITYQENKLGGYNFYQLGRRIYYSKPENEDDWTTQILYETADRRTNRLKKDTPLFRVTPKATTWFRRGPRLVQELNDAFAVPYAIVLRQKPDPGEKKRRVLPPEPPPVPPDPPDASKFATIVAVRKEIIMKQTGQVLKYFPNKLGGYTFMHDGKMLLYSKAYQEKGIEGLPMPYGCQTVWQVTSRDDLHVADLYRDTPTGKFRYREYAINDIGPILDSIWPILEEPNPVEPEKTTDDHWRELLGKP